MRLWLPRFFLFALLLGLGMEVAARADASGPRGVWVGQDGHDFVGPSSTPGPSDVQDLHVRLLGLPPARDYDNHIDRLGGGRWVYHGGWGPWAGHLERPAGQP